MPPLLLSDDEAVAAVVDLRFVALAQVDGGTGAAEAALRKLEQVLPPRLRHRMAGERTGRRTEPYRQVLLAGGGTCSAGTTTATTGAPSESTTSKTSPRQAAPSCPTSCHQGAR